MTEIPSHRDTPAGHAPGAETPGNPEYLEPEILDSEAPVARVNPEDPFMPIPLKPAQNPRWSAPSQPVEEPQHESYQDDVAEILSEIHNVTAVAQLESRVDAIEHDLTRIHTGRDEDEELIESELSAMKARVEEALLAVSAAVTGLKAATPAAEPVVERADAAIDQDALHERIRVARDDAIDAARTEAAARLKQIRSEVESQIATARAEFQSSFNGLLQGLQTGLQGATEQAVRETEKLRERFEPEMKKLREEFGDEASTMRRDLVSTEETFSGALRAFASRLEGLQSQISEAGARGAAERASFNANIQSLAQRVDALDERMAEGLARLSEGILRVAESIGSATTLQRRIAALESHSPQKPSA